MPHAKPMSLAEIVPSDVRRICKRFAAAGYRAWVVGGCTRDLLLGRPVHDWDLATNALPSAVMQLFPRVIPTGVQHGTVTVMLGPNGFEVTTLRGEGAYSDGRHPDSVRFVSDLREDLARRDFTINAIALDPLDGVLHDPFDGRSDLERRLIRAVGRPQERFGEDGLRVLRAARFAAMLDFDIEPATLAAIPSAHATLAKVSMERVRDELLKTMSARHPSRGLQIMLDTGILAVVLPELLPMVGCEQNKYHAYDVWTHTLHCVDASPDDVLLRLAALLHDVGKPGVRAIGEKTADYTFYEHERVGAPIADKICTRLKLSNEQRARVVHLVAEHLVVYDPQWSDAAVRRWIRRVGAESVADVLALARADADAKGVDSSDTIARLHQLHTRVDALTAQGAALTVRDLAINGNDLMRELQVPPGPWIGRILDHLLEIVLEDPSANQPDRLLHAARSFVLSGQASCPR